MIAANMWTLSVALSLMAFLITLLTILITRWLRRDVKSIKRHIAETQREMVSLRDDVAKLKHLLLDATSKPREGSR